MAEDTTTTEQTTPAQTTTQVTQEPAAINYEELLATDKGLQSFLDKQVTKATSTAVQNAIQKQQRLNDEKLSESDRLKVMTADEKATYYENKYKQTELARQRDKEVESLKTQTISMLAENKIPDAFLSVFGFDNATAEDIKQRVAMLAEYEYYPKGEFDKRVQAAAAEKLKTDPIENHGGQQNAPQKVTQPTRKADDITNLYK